VSFTLDVGCGDKPSGSVNCDLFVSDGKHRENKTVLKPKNIPNFIVCDVKHLPFRSNCFDLVFSSHVIEHIPNPALMLSEMDRVSRNRVKVICPHGFGDRLARRDKKLHINSMSGAWFKQSAAVLGCAVSVDYSQYYFFPHKYAPWLRFPLELTIEMWRR
jgi:ubiquinone/menaquinone biosynthesis C-methylase UbiE